VGGGEGGGFVPERGSPARSPRRGPAPGGAGEGRRGWSFSIEQYGSILRVVGGAWDRGGGGVAEGGEESAVGEKVGGVMMQRGVEGRSVLGYCYLPFLLGAWRSGEGRGER